MATGGGISLTNPIPFWQTNVSMSLNQGSTQKRNYPDVAMVADSVLDFYNNGTIDYVNGTSCGAPLWAGFMALVNEQAKLNGNPPPGFINPALYNLAEGGELSPDASTISPSGAIPTARALDKYSLPPPAL